MNAFNDLVRLELQPLVEVLASRQPNQDEMEPGHWLGVVEVLTQQLSRDFSDLPLLFRGRCSTAFTYALESAVASGAIDRRESVIRRLNLGSVLLRDTQPSVECDLLNPEFLITLLLEELPISAEEARALSVDWRSRSRSEIRLLRIVKNLLTPALAISQASGREADPRLKPWDDMLLTLP